MGVRPKNKHFHMRMMHMNISGHPCLKIRSLSLFKQIFYAAATAERRSLFERHHGWRVVWEGLLLRECYLV